MSTLEQEIDQVNFEPVADADDEPTEEVVVKKVSKKRKKKEVVDDDEEEVGDSDDKPSKKKKKKRRNTRSSRYPLVKRKCRNAYQIYINQQAEKNKQDGGDKKTPADYAAAWRAETDKSQWEELAKQELQEYIKEVRAHGYTYEDKKSTPSGDKKPSGPFLLYARDHHAKVQKEMGVKYTEALTELGRRWKADEIDPVLKQQYIDKASEEKRIYDERKAERKVKAEAESKTN
jgi:hypothetical protein